MTIDDYAIDRNIGARFDPQALANMHLIEWDLLFTAIVLYAPGCCRRQCQQRPHCRIGARAGTQLKYLTD